jgi:hypothetical protein
MSNKFELTENWQPTLTDFRYGESLGLSMRQMHDCFEEMRLWAFANANRSVARKSNWSMAFRSWMWRQAKEERNAATSPTMAAFDRLIARAEEIEGDGSPPMRDITP